MCNIVDYFPFYCTTSGKGKVCCVRYIYRNKAMSQREPRENEYKLCSVTLLTCTHTQFVFCHAVFSKVVTEPIFQSCFTYSCTRHTQHA